MTADNSPSGGLPTNGSVDVYPSFWNSWYADPAHTGALLAHEKQHQHEMDWTHASPAIANAYQATCLNPNLTGLNE